LTDAADALRAIVAEHAKLAVAWQTLGAVLNWARDHAGAEAAFRRALALDPANADAQFGIASTLLARGRFDEGWAAFALRPDRAIDSGPALASLPIWDGSATTDTLVVYAEQGFGDVVQFARYLAPARARVGRLVLLLDGYRAPLAPLLGGVAGVDQVLTDATRLAQTGAALRVSLLSLPHVLGADGRAQAAQGRYLAPPPDRAAAWSERLVKGPAPRVGLAWSVLARDAHGFVTRHKSVSPSVLAPLLATTDVTFVTLQPGDAGDPAAFGPAAARVVDLRADLRDFADTAAVLECLDLLISVDTSVVHLAGALARPVWTLLARGPDWRWTLDRTDSPWYPTMRLFRQPRLRDWRAVMEAVAGELRQFVAQRKEKQ
jgi:hypothetical protein